jgi:hypothetical protein
MGLPATATYAATLPRDTVRATAGPAGGSALLLTTAEERAAWWQEWYWRHLRLLAACPGRRALERLMESNR